MKLAVSSAISALHPYHPRAQFMRDIQLLIIRKRSWLYSLKCDTAAIISNESVKVQSAVPCDVMYVCCRAWARERRERRL